MFQRNKNSYEIVAECSNSQYSEEYTFIVDYDDDWGEIAEELFYDDFEVNPTRTCLISRTTL